ncbi:MAG: hypothetical protein AAF821_14445 [Cyanobacteria bacterium P01_D01_bin.156]
MTTHLVASAIAHSAPTIGPLRVLISPSGHYAVSAGETIEISLTIDNQGEQGAVIDVYLDESSQELCHWCSNPYERLALEMGHSSEVRFQVKIPIQTLPGSYDYLIVVDAPNHYPEDTPLRYPATINVLPPVESAINLNDATFATRPETRSDHPATLAPETPTEVQVIVHNRSNRVDQFRLEITDFPDDWYQVYYPEGLGELGLVIDTDYLALNPGSRGLIRLVVNCPVNTLAGRYLATLRLRSVNDPDLVLLDVMYFEVSARYELTVQPEAIIRRVKRQAALFHLHITNAGNTAREITIQAKEDREDPLFTYRLEPGRIRIPSMTTAHATLTATPDSLQKRAWIGPGRDISFRLVVNDQHDLPLPETTTAELLWERRPWWHMALILLLAAGGVSAIAGLIWWFFLRPPAPPRVTAFSTTAPTYYQQQQDFIRLTWHIDHGQQVQSIEIDSQTDTEGAALPPMVYDLSNGLPPDLTPYCVLEQALSCSNVLTGARQPGNYDFTLTVVTKGDGGQPITAETGRATILPTPPPEMVTFGATQTRYWEALAPELQQPTADDEPSPPKAMALNWQIALTEPLSHITLTGQLADGSPLSAPTNYDLTNGLPANLEEYCTLTETAFTCRELPTTAKTVGTYRYGLQAFTDLQGEPVATAETPPIPIVPIPIQIETFTLNGEEAPTKYQTVLSGEDNSTVNLAWKVLGGPYTQVELLPSPGTVPLAGSLDYPLTANTQETLTLKVTSVNGEEIVRSLTLETTASPEVLESLTIPAPPEPSPLPEATEPPSEPPIHPEDNSSLKPSSDKPNIRPKSADLRPERF